jgi:hypothetical protein
LLLVVWWFGGLVVWWFGGLVVWWAVRRFISLGDGNSLFPVFALTSFTESPMGHFRRRKGGGACCEGARASFLTIPLRNKIPHTEGYTDLFNTNNTV